MCVYFIAWLRPSLIIEFSTTGSELYCMQLIVWTLNMHYDRKNIAVLYQADISKRYFSVCHFDSVVTEGVITTRINRMKFRLPRPCHLVQTRLIYLFDRLNHWTLSKSVLNWLISQANWTALVKTFFYVTTKNWLYVWTRLSKKSFGFHRPPHGQKRLAPLAKRSTCSTSTCGHTFHILLIIRLFYWLLDK